MHQQFICQRQSALLGTLEIPVQILLYETQLQRTKWAPFLKRRNKSNNIYLVGMCNKQTLYSLTDCPYLLFPLVLLCQMTDWCEMGWCPALQHYMPVSSATTAHIQQTPAKHILLVPVRVCRKLFYNGFLEQQYPRIHVSRYCIRVPIL